MKLFYHGDMDGIASAYILLNNIVPQETRSDALIRMKKQNDVLIEFDYNKQQDLKNIQFQSRENVYFVDCSPDKDILDYILSKVASVFIIDHHISRQEMIEQYLKDNKIKGMFYNGASATLITYCWVDIILKNGKTTDEVKEFLDWFGLSRVNQERSDIPLSIKLINSWDIWNGFYADAEPYKINFESKHLNPSNKEIKDLLYNNRIIIQTIKKGHIMKEQMDTWAETFMNRYGYEISYEGHKFFVANLGNGNSKYFGDKIKDYDAVIPYCYNGKYWTFSIYSDSEKEFDCSEFAKKFGGGGHKKAAGFKIEQLPEWLMTQKK